MICKCWELSWVLCKNSQWTISPVLVFWFLVFYSFSLPDIIYFTTLAPAGIFRILFVFHGEVVCSWEAQMITCWKFFWVSFGGMVLLKEVCHWGQVLRFEIPWTQLSLCFLIWFMIWFLLLSQTSCLLFAAIFPCCDGLLFPPNHKYKWTLLFIGCLGHDDYHRNKKVRHLIIANYVSNLTFSSLK